MTTFSWITLLLLVLLVLPDGYAINFTFSIQNSSYLNLSDANVTLYNISFGMGGKTKKLLAWNVTGSEGKVNLTAPSVNNLGGELYEIGIMWPAGQPFVMEVGPTLPPLDDEGINHFLNGSTIYTAPAKRLNLYAYNASGNHLLFSYVIFDDALGIPVGEFGFGNVWNATADLVSTRNYTLMFFVQPGGGQQNFIMRPPVPYSANNLSSYASNANVLINISMAFTAVNVSGNISVAGNSSEVNITSLVVRNAPSLIIPPMPTLSGTYNNYSLIGTGGAIASYTLEMPGLASGLGYVIEAHGKTAGSTTGAAYFADMRYLIVNTSNVTYINLNMTPIGGIYQVAADSNLGVNTSIYNLSVKNAQSLTEALRELIVEIRVKNLYSQVLRYFKSAAADTTNGGGVVQFIAQNLSNITTNVFNGEFAPSTTKLPTNISVHFLNLTAFEPRFIEGSGAAATGFSNVSDTAIKIKFTKNILACNRPDPDNATCSIGSTFGGTFNPIQSAISNKVNVYTEINTGVASSSGRVIPAATYFLGVDMLSSGPPETLQSTNGTSTTAGSTVEQFWKFGSPGPDIYDEILVAIPYSNSTVNDSQQINITINALYDEDLSLIWNISHYNATNLSVPTEYADYNITFFNASAGGVPCSTTDYNATCFVNTTNDQIWLRVPHFSTSGISANAQQAATSSDPTPNPQSGSGSGSGGGGGGTSGGGIANDPNVLSTQQRFWTSIGANQKVTMQVNDVISTISITPSITAAAVTLRVKKLKDRPTAVATKPDDLVRSYFDITTTNIQSNQFSNIDIAFSVEKSWISENGIDISTLSLYRYSKNQWYNLITTKTGEDAESTTFTAKSPGLSLFAIAASAAPQNEELPQTEEQESREGMTASQNEEEIKQERPQGEQKKKSKLWIWIALTIVVLSTVIFLLFRKRGKE